MTTEDLLRAIGGVDEKELAQAQRKTVKPIIWAITVAVLAAALLLPILLIRREAPLTHTAIAEKPSWNMDADISVQPEQLMCALTGTPAWESEFASSLTVHARLIDMLPDTYAIPEKTLARDNYRVLQLEVMQTVVGTDIPGQIWFLLPEYYAADLAGLDLLIALDQVGVENYLLFNTTRQQYETFSLVFSVGVLSHEQEPLQEYAPDPTAVSTDMRLSILPFKDGSLHWPAGEAWDYLGRYFTSCVTNVDTTTPIDPDPTLEEAKNAVRRAHETEYFQKLPQARVRHASEFNPSVELAGFNTEEGIVFSQILHQYENKLLLCRVIDGFYASECYIYYDDGRILESDVKFTPEDIAALPKLTPVVRQVLERAPENGTCRKLIGYYYKTDNGDLFGVVQAAWEVSGQPVLSVNMLVTTDGTVSQISDETLQLYMKGNWDTAAEHAAWDAITERSYKSQIIYENRGEFINPPGKDYYITKDLTLICSDYYEPYEAIIQRSSPQAAELSGLLIPDEQYWPSTDIHYKAVTGQLKYIWYLQEGSVDDRRIRYLLMLEDGTLLLALGYDFTGVYEDSTATRTIEFLVQLTEYADAAAFFDQWESSAIAAYKTRPEYYRLYETLRKKYD